MTDEKEACIYERRGQLFIRTCLQTQVGLWMEDGPCVMLDASSEPVNIGLAARDALARSGRIIPHAGDGFFLCRL